MFKYARQQLAFFAFQNNLSSDLNATLLWSFCWTFIYNTLTVLPVLTIFLSPLWYLLLPVMKNKVVALFLCIKMQKHLGRKLLTALYLLTRLLFIVHTCGTVVPHSWANSNRAFFAATLFWNGFKKTQKFGSHIHRATIFNKKQDKKFFSAISWCATFDHLFTILEISLSKLSYEALSTILRNAHKNVIITR